MDGLVVGDVTRSEECELVSVRESRDDLPLMRSMRLESGRETASIRRGFDISIFSELCRCR